MYPFAQLSGGLVAGFGKEVELGMSFRQVVDERWMLERAQETGFTFTIERTHVVYTKGFFEKLGYLSLRRMCSLGWFLSNLL